MHRTRREFLIDAGAVAALSTAGESALAASRKAKLEPWRYGNGSWCQSHIQSSPGCNGHQRVD